MIDILRNVEGRAVLDHTAARRQGELPGGQQLAIDLEFGETPSMRSQAADAAAHPLFDIAVEVLEVLRAKEHAFGPDDLVIPGHDSTHDGNRQRPPAAAAGR